MSRGRGGRFPRGRSDVHAPRSSSEIFTLRGPGGVVIPPIVPRRRPMAPPAAPDAWFPTGGAAGSIGRPATHGTEQGGRDPLGDGHVVGAARVAERDAGPDAGHDPVRAGEQHLDDAQRNRARSRRRRPGRRRAGVTAVPDFGVDLGPELEAAMAEHRREVEAIAAGPWPPGFADTIAALEAAGDRLPRAERLLDDASAARSTPEIRALDAELRPRLAAHRDAV